MKPLLILAFFALFFSGSCKKEEPELQLPPYTQQGNNVFACKINGEIFIANGRSKCHYGVYTDHDSTIKIFALENQPKKATFGISFGYTNNQEIFTLKTGIDNSAYIYIPVTNKQLAESKFTTDLEHIGSVEVKYFQNNILAGTFEFDATDEEGNIIHITEGRFDVTQ